MRCPMMRRPLPSHTSSTGRVCLIRFAGMVTVLFRDESHPTRLAVVQLDASARPDVADLARVFRAEGVRRINHAPPRYGIERGSECMIITLAMTDPVYCEFSLVLPWAPYQVSFNLMKPGVFLSYLRRS